MTANLSIAENDYFVRKLNENVAPNTHLNDIKIRYWVKFVGSFLAGTTFHDMEWAWLVKVISDSGQDSSGRWSDKWRKMVIAVGKTPTKYQKQNKLLFYLNAP